MHATSMESSLWNTFSFFCFSSSQRCPHNLTSPEIAELYNAQMIDQSETLEQREWQKSNIQATLISEGRMNTKMGAQWDQDATKALRLAKESRKGWDDYYAYKARAAAAGPGPEAQTANQKAELASKKAFAAMLDEMAMSEIASIEATAAEENRQREAANGTII